MRASIMAVASTKKKSVFVDRVCECIVGLKITNNLFPLLEHPSLLYIELLRAELHVTCGVKVKQIALIVYRTTNYQYQQTEMESKSDPFYSSKDSDVDITHLNSLPHGIIQASSDLKLKPLWSTSNSKSKGSVSSSRNLLAMTVGIKQKKNVDTLVQKFLSENFTIILFHYDGHVDGWWDLQWSKEAVHIVANNQTKWYEYGE